MGAKSPKPSEKTTDHRDAKARTITMARSDLDALDDVSFCVGDEEEGFRESASVCDSDVSLTDGGSDCGDDDGVSLWSNDASEMSLDASLEKILDEVRRERGLPDEVSFSIEGKDKPQAPECTGDMPENQIAVTDNKQCKEQRSEESTDTGHTSACSGQDTLEDARSYLSMNEQGFPPQEYVYHSVALNEPGDQDDEDLNDMSVLTDAQDRLCVDEIKAKASTTMVATTTVAEDEFEKVENCCDVSDSGSKRAAHLAMDDVVVKASDIMVCSDVDTKDYGHKRSVERGALQPDSAICIFDLMAHFSKPDKHKT